MSPFKRAWNTATKEVPILRRTSGASAKRRFPRVPPCLSYLSWHPVEEHTCLNGKIGERGFSTARHLFDDKNAFQGSTYLRSFEFPIATCDISDLSNSLIGTDVTLHGYLGPRSDLSKKLSFAPLYSKDLSKILQVVSVANVSKDGTVDPSAPHAILRTITPQSPVTITGKLKAKKPSKSDSFDQRKFQSLELELQRIQALGQFPSDVLIAEGTRFPAEERNLQLRFDFDLQRALRFRADVTKLCRDELGSNQRFLEVETPILFKSTPEGAREFLVPTRERGLAYALPQSPQQYKQILMASGIPKYYQIAKCFRDEDLRADRQPEFTQLDLEMSFATSADVMNGIETLLTRLWKELLGMDIPGPFLRMPYDDAMARYGSDKPDMRFGMEISRCEHVIPADLVGKISPLTIPIVDAMRFQVSDNPNETRAFAAKFMDSPEAVPFLRNPDGQPGIFIYDTTKPLRGLQPLGFEAAETLEDQWDLESGDLVIMQARANAPLSGGSTAMGRLRLALHAVAVTTGMVEPPSGFQFLWVKDFPLLSKCEDGEVGQGSMTGLASTHHPFTAPKTADDVALLDTDPLLAKADHYDIVVNGVELGGGSRRIHDAKFQEYMLKDILKLSEARLGDFKHLLDVLRMGCPPHAGIALGLDRLVAVMLGRNSVRDVIAFPKTGSGEDPLVKSPSRMTAEQLKTYHLALSKS
ncbi:hypothetical protein P152DRAFT_460572 [Eremomyces bilateralis CBS 781.70]|uniref:Aminoacyl-transfer RNA synthetases class-II family profile domain-containing protein n=1 Tax=Eremomyces bilateralis CBS 781.70 TaxID=1392243 RepID=A0A6G1FX25_9PEZI|nr:uncharacterized protein P152DRAFT_460572 [Eremomyces bilateralis CBS 781.70]KAF1810445.1 hypothetical protein P152DRAFT_460572 [Eremomyces bilateralis CBS 781.70]